MAQDYAKSFYQSKAWRETSRLYMSSKHYICERCGGVGRICHHRKYITPYNINNPNITLSLDNLECLCHDCHQQEHAGAVSRVVFDEAGNIQQVKETREITDFKRAVEQLEKLQRANYGKEE